MRTPARVVAVAALVLAAPGCRPPALGDIALTAFIGDGIATVGGTIGRGDTCAGQTLSVTINDVVAPLHPGSVAMAVGARSRRRRAAFATS